MGATSRIPSRVLSQQPKGDLGMLGTHSRKSWHRTRQAARTALTQTDVPVWQSNIYKNNMNLLNF